MKLSDTKCRNAKPKDKPYKIFDGGGLYLRVEKGGGKLWRMKYRFAGKEKILSFGKYPIITLQQARDKCLEAKRLLADDIDPSQHKQQQKMLKAVSDANTFEAVAREWFEKKKDEVKANTYKNMVDRLEMNLFPSIGKLPIKDVTAPILIQALKPVEKRGALDTVKRLRQYCSQIFRFAIAHGKAEYNPAPDIVDALKKGKTEHFKSMPIEELPNYIGKINSNTARVFSQTLLALRLMNLTFTRKSELALAEWEELNFDKAQWIVPAERTKMKKDHIVPLSKQALAIFKELYEMNGHKKYVFPSVQKLNQAMHPDTLLRALYKFGYKGKATIHGFRALAMSTIKQELGYRHEVPDLQLAHGKKNKIDAAYDRAEFLAERTKMMQEWADYVEGLK